jgi:hypothetical protein
MQLFPELGYMQLTETEYAAYHKATSDFRSDHDKPSEIVRKKFNIPENRYFSVRSDGLVMVDLSRKRIVESRKLSKSDQ